MLLKDIEKVFYINLDERSDRKLMVQRELLKIFEYDVLERFPAIKEKNGALGCSKSHLEVLKLAISRGYKNYIVVEDDFQIIDLPNLQKSMEQYNTVKNKIKCDILLLTANTYQFAQTNLKHLIRSLFSYSTMGYLVQESYYDKLKENFEEGISLLTKTAQNKKYAIDVFWHKLQKEDMWLQLFPVCIIQRPDFSNITGKIEDYTESILQINKYYKE
jgi:glycosyl transferase, family 25